MGLARAQAQVPWRAPGRGLSPEATFTALVVSDFSRVDGRNKEPFYPTQRVGHGHRAITTKCSGRGLIFDKFRSLKDPIMTTTAGAL